MHGHLDYHRPKALNALLTTEANEQVISAQDDRFDGWFGDLFSVRYVIMVCMCCVATFIFIPNPLNPRLFPDRRGMRTSPVTL